jgi:hypothetical protein
MCIHIIRRSRSRPTQRQERVTRQPSDRQRLLTRRWRVPRPPLRFRFEINSRCSTRLRVPGHAVRAGLTSRRPVIHDSGWESPCWPRWHSSPMARQWWRSGQLRRPVLSGLRPCPSNSARIRRRRHNWHDHAAGVSDGAGRCGMMSMLSQPRRLGDLTPLLPTRLGWSMPRTERPGSGQGRAATHTGVRERGRPRRRSAAGNVVQFGRELELQHATPASPRPDWLSEALRRRWHVRHLQPSPGRHRPGPGTVLGATDPHLPDEEPRNSRLISNYMDLQGWVLEEYS